MAELTTSLSWSELADQKEREWKEVTRARIKHLELVCQEKDKKLQKETKKFEKLKEDFKYNLRLLQERDQELERYDVTFTDFKTQLNKKNAEISDLKIHIDEMQTLIKREAASREELQIHYQQRLREKQAEVDGYRNSKDQEVSQERNEFEQFKRNLQQKLTAVEAEADMQQRKLIADFDDMLKKREHEFRIQIDEMNAKILEYELKAKLLAKELEILKDAENKRSVEFQQAENGHKMLEKKLKETEWQLVDTSAMKDAQISDLMNKVQQSESLIVQVKEDFNRRCGEMDRKGRERDAAHVKVKEAAAERQAELQKSLQEIHSQHEDAKIKISQLEWSNQDLVKERDMQMEKFQEEMQKLKENWDRNVADLSHRLVTYELDLQAYHENDGKYKSELQQRKQDIERYKKELNLSAEREAALERKLAQVELDWQRRYEEAELVQYDKSEHYIKNLMTARDEALASVSEKHRELEQKEMLIKALQREKSLAVATLKKHDIPLDKNLNGTLEKSDKFSESVQIQQLQDQNQKLRVAMQKIRQQYVADLGQTVAQNLSKHSVPENGYAQELEKEVRDLKRKNQELVEKLASVDKESLSTPEDSRTGNNHVQDNIIVKNHIQVLNNKIADLQKEKLELSAQVRKQQARLQHLEQNNEELIKQPRQKQVEMEQLQYMMNAQTRRHEAETGSLKQRLSDLELQLTEARKEADEYYRSSLEHTAEITSLNNQVSSLKIQLAEKRPPLNFGAQELVIQQLQDEIMQLRQGVPSNSRERISARGSTDDASNAELQRKLHGAAKHIAQLAREKQQLIEIGNRLRSELKKAGIVPLPEAQNNSAVDKNRQKPEQKVHRSPVKDARNSKLTQLEQLQYQLTKQELQIAQRFSPPPTDGSLDLQPQRLTESILGSDLQLLQQDSGGILPRPGNARELRVSWDDLQDPVDAMFSMSFGSSAQEPLRLVEHSPSPSLFSPRSAPRSPKGRGQVSNSNRTGDTSDHWQLKGHRAVVLNKPQPKPAQLRVPKPSQRQKPQVRNYNIHDNSAVQ